MSVLETTGVAKRYRRHEVLRGVSFSVEPGEVVGLTGENGCGKSTLLRIVVGLLEPDSGEVRLDGTQGYCPQEPVLFDALTLAENLRYFGTASGLTAGEIDARTSVLLERLRCTDHARRPVGVLSGGTKQKLNLIVALLHQPTLLILDEPYQGFDFESYLAFWSMADELREQSMSLLVVSHLLLDRGRFDRVYALRDGVAHIEG